MTQPTREALVKLRDSGLTREKMAEHFDVSVTTIRRLIKLYAIPRPSKQARRRRESHLARGGAIIAPLVDDRPILERAIEILGDRFEHKRHYGYYLDGRPVHTDKVVAAAGLKYKRI